MRAAAMSLVGLPIVQAPSCPLYGISDASASPCFKTHSMANSAVAPLQPPSPPQWRGFGVHMTISCAENGRGFHAALIYYLLQDEPAGGSAGGGAKGSGEMNK